MSARRRILFLSTWCPYPLDNGSRIRQYYLLHSLAERHDVTLFTFLPSDEYRASLPVLQTFCRKVVGIPARLYRARSPRALLGLLNPLPRSLAATYSAEMAEAIHRETRQTDYDVFIAGEIGGARYVQSAKTCTAILDDPELAFLYDQLLPTRNRLTLWRHSLTRVKFERFMRKMLKRYAASSVVSPAERDLLAPLTPSGFPIAIIPNGVDTERNRPSLLASKPNTLIYAGSLLYSANWDAVDFFLREIFPRIQACLPQVTLTVTGRHDGNLPGTSILREGVTFAGFVDDVRVFVAASSVAVIPLRQGAGTRLKVLEAMALGTPVVSTTKGIEGLEMAPGQHILVADEPSAFADAVVCVLQDANLRQSLVNHARCLVEAQYDWRRIGAQMNDLIEATVSRKGVG